MVASRWWVYVIQSEQVRVGKRGRPLPGFHYVGCTTDPKRRIRQHNGTLVGGGIYTSKHRNWQMRAIYGPYRNRSEALKAEYALKHGKRGRSRCFWSTEDSVWCRGLGVEDPLVDEINAVRISGLEATLVPQGPKLQKK